MPEQEVFDTPTYRIEVNDIGTTCYYNNVEQLHRDDGPAVEWANGTRHWYQNGVKHRENGPAIESVNGHKLWLQNGLLHRTDGPAVEWCDGDKRWYINGEELTEAEFNQRVKMPEQEVFDALKYRIEVDKFGTRRYYNSVEQLHRDGGPAVVWANSDNFWYQNGQLHRTDGPAVEWGDGTKEWWLNGRMMTEEEFIQAVKNV